MANHITTVCTVTGSPADIARFTAAHFRKREKDQSDFFDLGTIVPKPAIVDQTESGTEAEIGFYALTGLVHQRFGWSGGNPMVAYAQHGEFKMNQFTTYEDFAEWLAEHKPQALEKGRRSLQCFRETGFRDWYDWSCSNWGTKWNTYDFKRRESADGRLVFQFQTANGVPEPVFAKLTEMYPEVVFDTVSIDEGGPEYVGRFTATERRLDKVEHSPDRYMMVYGRKPYSDDDENEEMN